MDGVSRYIRHAGTAAEIGGKAAALSSLAMARLPIPEWFAVVPPNATTDALPPDLDRELREAVARLAPNGELLAVRSSAREEDGAEHSFAGQFESHLYVRPADVPARVADVWRSAASDRVAAYRAERGLGAGESPGLPAVLVQRMIHPRAAGVAFSADPVSGRRGTCVVSATAGVGDRLVSGQVDGDTWHVARDGSIVARVPAGATPSLEDADVARVAALARAAERHFGRPQDIEWAIAGDALFLLQSRPITSLAALPDPDGRLALWDNSNITESYGGVTTPLTFSFARYVYEEVYRQFCRIVGVPESRIEGEREALRVMLGLVRGRVYYNLASWYRILALLPGYRLNRRFMEQMMGVKEGLPPELEAEVVSAGWRGRAGDALLLLRTIAGLVRAHRRLPRDIRAFHRRLDEALHSGGDLARLRPDELVAHYRDLERQLLTRWDAPLVNDFFAMIFYGVLRSLATKWLGDENGTLQNDLVSGEGAIVSAEPAQRIERMGVLAAGEPAVAQALAHGTLAEAQAALRTIPALEREYDEYIQRFGDRCLEELKLETTTLADDPRALLRSVGRLAQARLAGTLPAPRGERIDVRAEAERRAFAALGESPLRRAVFGWVLRNARERVRDRENLRFERTRVFGRVRRIFLELGKRYAAVGALDDPRDVFWLTVDEALGWPAAITAGADIRGLAAVRRAEFARYRELEPPADRFETRGLVHVGHDFRAPAAIAEPPAADGDSRSGIGCYPGVVRGRVRVVRDPRGAVLEPGEILVAERTDPGWVMLFPAASALLVERGSLLSHSAIVARELGIPAVVSVEGLTGWLNTGDEVAMDGRTGLIRRLAAEEAAT